jgi:hypothetical protein
VSLDSLGFFEKGSNRSLIRVAVIFQMFLLLFLEMQYFSRLKVKSIWLNNVQKLLICRVFSTECDVIVLVILPWSWHIPYIVQIPSANGKRRLFAEEICQNLPTNRKQGKIYRILAKNDICHFS